MYICVGKQEPLLTREEINSILNNSHFYTNGLMFVIEENGYNLDLPWELKLADYMSHVRTSYWSGKTIVVKGLENYNEKIAQYSRDLGLGTDVHMYLTPENGTAFGFHEDDRTVHIRRIFGNKSFIIKRGGADLPYDLHDEYAVRIEQGESHRALVDGPSCHLSFGILDNFSIGNFFFV